MFTPAPVKPKGIHINEKNRITGEGKGLYAASSDSSDMFSPIRRIPAVTNAWTLHIA
jgi:hypothetical protein